LIYVNIQYVWHSLSKADFAIREISLNAAVRGDQNGGFGKQAPRPGEHRFGGGGIQPLGWLIEQQNLGIAQQNSCENQASGLTAR